MARHTVAIPRRDLPSMGPTVAQVNLIGSTVSCGADLASSVAHGPYYERAATTPAIRQYVPGDILLSPPPYSGINRLLAAGPGPRTRFRPSSPAGRSRSAPSSTNYGPASAEAPPRELFGLSIGPRVEWVRAGAPTNEC